MIGLTLSFPVVKKDIVLLQNHHFFDASERIKETTATFIDVFYKGRDQKGQL